jgi:hypothetical protein
MRAGVDRPSDAVRIARDFRAVRSIRDDWLRFLDKALAAAQAVDDGAGEIWDAVLPVLRALPARPGR